MNNTVYANNLFEQPWWLDIVVPGQWREVIERDKNDNVIGRFVFVKDKNKIIMPELTQTLGIWFSDDVKIDYSSQKKVINNIFSKLGDLKSIAVDLSPENSYILPFRWLGFRLEPRFTYRINDLSDCDSIYQRFGKTAKKNIKYARNKVSIYENTDVDVLWNMLNKTFEAQKRKNPMSKELVYRIVEECEKNGHGKYFEARDSENNVHSCAYFVYDEKVCYYLLGASDSTFRSSGAQSLIIWEAIQFAATKSEAFDFEGSMVEGIENFFKQFGGKCIPYYSIKKQSLFADILDMAKPRIKKIFGYKN